MLNKPFRLKRNVL